MSIRINLFRSLLVLLASAAFFSCIGYAQETLPSLDGLFPVPEATNSQSPFEDEKTLDNQLVPKLDLLPKKNTGSLNNLFSHQWVRTSADDSLRGTVVTLVGQDTLSVSGAKVSLAQRGRVVATVQSNADGEYVFDNIPPGYYSIIADADNSFATYGLAVMNNESGSHLPESVELRVIRPKSEEIRRLLITDTIPTQISDTDQQFVRDPISSKRVFSKSHRVLSTKDGRVVGHLSRLGIAPEVVDMSQMKAILLKDGNTIFQSDVTKEGRFEFENVAPGCYGFAAVGNKGVAAVAFCVVRPDALTQRKTSDGKLFVVAVQDDAVSELNVELADTADVMSTRETTNNENTVNEEVAEEEATIPQPMMPFGGSNMFGAGQIIPGGSKYGNIMEGVVGIGGLAAIAYAIAKNDDDDEATVVSPIVAR